MNYIEGIDRKQIVLFAKYLDDIIDKNNEVRAIDVFVNSLDMKELGFVMDKQITGRPAYNPATLLKLYIYSYLNRTRSSREIEKDCKRNIELMWLINNLQPDHNTIANFRKNNPQPIRKVFEATVKIAKNKDLIGNKLIAGDSVKLRAQNSKKNNFNKEKLENQIAYLNKKIDDYNQLLDTEDTEFKEVTQEKKNLTKSASTQTPLINEVKKEYVKTVTYKNEREAIASKIEKHLKQKNIYENYLNELSQSNETQISKSDPDSRNLPIRQQITEICYSIQATAEAQNKILLDYEVTNKTDKAALYNSVSRAAVVLETNDFVALYDKGYFSGAEIAKSQKLGVTTMVSIPPRASTGEIPTPNYYGNKFVYNKENDTYLCPEKQILTSNGTVYKSNQGEYKQYKTNACRTCVAQKKCTSSKRGIRIIERSQYAENVELNQQLIEQNTQLYRLRQEIIEHPFGTIKRQWGFDHTIMKRGKDRVASDIGLIFIAYNLRRLLTLLINNPKKDKNRLKMILIIKKFIQKFLNALSI